MSIDFIHKHRMNIYLKSKKMKHLINIFFIVTLVVSSQAQSIDVDRMHRDLEVAQHALSTIITPKNNQLPRFNYYFDEIDADYIKDYGVIFMISSEGFGKVKLFGVPESVHVSPDDKENSDKLKASVAGEKDHFIENSKTFLADYAGIIGQLDEDQMISIRRGGGELHVDKMDLERAYIAKSGSGTNTQTFWSTNMNAANNSELIIEVGVGKINALRKGKISRDDFFKAVNVVENVRDYSKDADLETLSAMFHRLYEKDLSKTYYSERQPKYSKLANFGVIVKMKFYSSYEDNNVYSMPTIAKKGLTLEERNQFVMDLLPQFESEFKENLVNYGRTLKNLDSDELILFEINMTTCKNCKDFPRVMKFSVKKSALHKYNRGKISMTDAIKKVNVERILD